MKVQATNQIFQAKKFKLPINFVTYYENGKKCTKRVNWVRVFTEPNAEIYYQKLIEARKANNTVEVKHWADKMGEFKIVDLDKAKPNSKGMIDLLG